MVFYSYASYTSTASEMGLTTAVHVRVCPDTAQSHMLASCLAPVGSIINMVEPGKYSSPGIPAAQTRFNLVRVFTLRGSSLYEPWFARYHTILTTD
jgi:hypothetical protein